jgi:hypothetical protein
MGRQNNYHSYVKQGCDEAQIELEIKGYPGKRNPVIWCRFTKENNQSDWKLNSEVLPGMCVPS